MRIPARATLLALLLIGGPTLRAAEWKFDPTLQLRGGYDDNIRITTDNEVSSAVGIFSPSGIFSVTTPTSGANGEVRFDFRRFEEDSDLDDNNSTVNLDLYRTYERSRLGFDFSFVNDTTLDSQLEATGLVFDRIRRRQISASPSWAWLLSERTNLRANYNYTDVEYKNAAGTGFVNYTLNSGGLTLSRVLSERSNASITLSGTRSDNDNDVQSTNGNLQGGVSYNFSSTLSASLFVGVRRTEIDYSSTSLVPVFSGNVIIGFMPVTQDVTSSDWGGTFNASVTKKFLRGEIALSASRDISNDINGTPVEVDRYRWLNLYRLSETLSVNLNLDLYDSQLNNSLGQNLDRRYYQAETRFTWRFAQFWNVAGSYRYRKQIFASTNDEATQNAAYLTLTYQWPRISVSR